MIWHRQPWVMTQVSVFTMTSHPQLPWPTILLCCSLHQAYCHHPRHCSPATGHHLTPHLCRTCCHLMIHTWLPVTMTILLLSITMDMMQPLPLQYWSMVTWNTLPRLRTSPLLRHSLPSLILSQTIPPRRQRALAGSGATNIWRHSMNWVQASNLLHVVQRQLSSCCRCLPLQFISQWSSKSLWDCG